MNSEKQAQHRIVVAIIGALMRSKASVAETQAGAESALAELHDFKAKTVDELRAEDLTVPNTKLRRAQKRLDDVPEGLLSWWARTRASRELTQATVALAAAQAIADSEHMVEQRMAQAAEQRQKQQACDAARDKLNETINWAEQWHTWFARMQTTLEPLAECVERGGWTGWGTTAQLVALSAALKSGEWSKALIAGQSIAYQALPSRAQWEAWSAECAREVLNLDRRAGFAATAGASGIIDASLSLCALACDPEAWDPVMADEEVLGRWHALPLLLADPSALRSDVQWILYWSLLPVTQQFAIDLNDAIPNEEHLTGNLLADVRTRLRAFTTPRIELLGYPGRKAVIGTLSLGGKHAEALTGADVGIIVRIEIGELAVHKVALMQGKYSKNGRANVGSDPTGPRGLTQLEKLNSPERDFYLFYHQGVGGSPAMLPTVTPVTDLIAAEGWTAADLRRASLVARTQRYGWDLASYVAFGLCGPDSGLGLPIADESDPLEALLAGGREVLPDYLLVIVIGDSDRTLEYVQRLKSRYKPERPKVRGPNPTRPRPRVEPEPRGLDLDEREP